MNRDNPPSWSGRKKYNRPARADWRSLNNENKILFLVLKNKTNELNNQNKIRTEERSKIFSLLALLYKMLDNVTWHRTERRSSAGPLNGSCCVWFIVYALSSRAAQVIWRPEKRTFEDELTKYGKRKETEVKMYFSFTWIWMLPSLKLGQQK